MENYIFTSISWHTNHLGNQEWSHLSHVIKFWRQGDLHLPRLPTIRLLRAVGSVRGLWLNKVRCPSRVFEKPLEISTQTLFVTIEVIPQLKSLDVINSATKRRRFFRRGESRAGISGSRRREQSGVGLSSRRFEKENKQCESSLSSRTRWDQCWTRIGRKRTTKELKIEKTKLAESVSFKAESKRWAVEENHFNHSLIWVWSLRRATRKFPKDREEDPQPGRHTIPETSRRRLSTSAQTS